MRKYIQRIITSALVVVAIPALGGCATGRTPHSGVTPTYISLYRSGDYDGAFEATKSIPSTHHGSERLIAGMSLAAMDKPVQAKAWLQPLVSSPDRQIRGRAKATMGILLAQEKSHNEAARLLDGASRDLAGPMRGWAAHYGAQEFGFSGDNLRAERLRHVATLRGPSYLQAINIGQFTVQLGSFSSRTRAQSRVRDTLSAAQLAGLDRPRVEMTMAGNRPLYAVRVGNFGSSADAQAASDRFPGDTAVIRTN